LVPYLISFFGPDGAGKSTHVELLLKHFQSNRTKVRKVWIRSPHTLAYLLSCLLVKIGFYRTTVNPFGMQVKVPAVHTNLRLGFFWSMIELVSVLPLILFRVYVPLFLGYTLIAERYVVDTAVTIAYFINDVGFLQSHIAKLLLLFIPKNTIFIHLDSDYSTIMKRRDHIVEPYDFIKFQRMAYKIMESSVSAILINTSNISIEQTSERIMDWIKINGIL
jgi:hypothetical protein